MLLAMQEVEQFDSQKAFEREQVWRFRAGWRIAQVIDQPQRAGLARFATLGLGALVLKPKSKLLVIWEKDD